MVAFGAARELHARSHASGFGPQADVAQTRSGRRHGGRKGDVALRAPAAERRYADSRGRSASPGRAPTFA
jgi:hypothetical protein